VRVSYGLMEINTCNIGEYGLRKMADSVIELWLNVPMGQCL
jgi:hypothetical protein